MSNVLRCIHRFLQSDDGPTSVEYCVLLALIIAACLFGISLVGDNAEKTFSQSANALEAKKPPPQPSDDDD